MTCLTECCSSFSNKCAVYDGVHDGKVLGTGITGDVRLITRKDTGIQRALKRLDLSDLRNKEDLNTLLEEVKIMCALDHPNIVCLEEVYEGDSKLYLTQELCTGGDLFDRLEAVEELTNESYTEKQCARIVRQIISSVAYLHSKNIIHRDLKLENFLFSDESNTSDLKMIDFGLSKHFNVGELQHEHVGTPYTVAPEVIRSKDGYDAKVDVWAIGVITYLLLSGDTPFGGASPDDNLKDVRDRILLGRVSFDDACWNKVSHLAIDFIQSILVLNPLKRPNVEELPKHPWLVSMKRTSSSCSDDDGPVPLDPKVVSGLVNFKEKTNTTKFLCEVLSFTLQPVQLGLLRAEFEKLDTKGKGEIHLEEFKTALLGNDSLTDIEIEEIFNGLHVRNRDMSMRWHEFIAACLSQCQIDERNIKLAFDRLDSEHKGYITVDDMKNIMDFYGSDRRDLQQTWINDIIDYKSNKEHMTYDDFYKLLKIDRLHIDPESSDYDLANPRSGVAISRRRSSLDSQHHSPIIVNAKKTRKNLAGILHASNHSSFEDESSHSKRRTSLILSRSAEERELALLGITLDATI